MTVNSLRTVNLSSANKVKIGNYDNYVCKVGPII